MSDLTLSNQADRRLQIMRNGVMGMVRLSDFLSDTHDFAAADVVLQKGVAACYEHLTTLQEAQVEVMAAGLAQRNNEKGVS
jgi:hypothetical protein